MDRILDPTQKAFEINLDDRFYGTFAEIGAGQEVARHFFRAGGAAGTIAKSMSAYDMTVSDDIYGKSGRYVSRQRVETMLKREFEQLVERLDGQRGDSTCFFAFADTVAAKSFKYTADCHGWMGVQFQHDPKSAPSRVLLHVTMLDQANLQQQEALGVIGTNLIYACYKHASNRDEFIASLMHHLSLDRIKVDFIDICGEAFEKSDSRVWSLDLVKRNYCDAVMFNQKGEICAPKDELYKKNIVVCRGSYRPPTLVNIDMLESGTKAFVDSLEKEQKDKVIILPEISMSKLKERGEVNSEDFLARVELLASLGHNVLISSFDTYGDLNYYLSNHTQMRLAFVMGYYNLSEVFNNDKYTEQPGGLFGGLGALLGHRTNIYVYPAKDEKNDNILISEKAEVETSLQEMICYLKKHNRIFDLKDFNKEVFHIWSRIVLKMIQNKESGWEDMVPKGVAKTVKDQCLFEYPCDPQK